MAPRGGAGGGGSTGDGKAINSTVHCDFTGNEDPGGRAGEEGGAGPAPTRLLSLVAS